MEPSAALAALRLVNLSVWVTAGRPALRGEDSESER